MYHKWQSYDVWFMSYGAWLTQFFVILDCFSAFYPHPPNNPKNQNFEKMKKPPGDIITLHICTINDNHMMYGLWVMEHDWQFFVILDCFLPYLITLHMHVPKMTLIWCMVPEISRVTDTIFLSFFEILQFYSCVPWMTIIWCMVPEICSMRDRIFCHFWPFFALLPP